MSSRIPITKNTEIFRMRISQKMKDKLKELAKKSGYGGTASSAIRVLINSAMENLD